MPVKNEIYHSRTITYWCFAIALLFHVSTYAGYQHSLQPAFRETVQTELLISTTSTSSKHVWSPATVAGKTGLTVKTLYVHNIRPFALANFNHRIALAFQVMTRKYLSYKGLSLLLPRKISFPTFISDQDPPVLLIG